MEEARVRVSEGTLNFERPEADSGISSTSSTAAGCFITALGNAPLWFSNRALVEVEQDDQTDIPEATPVQ